MKLKQLARTFLKVGKIINIILIPVFAVLLVVFIIINSVAIAAAVADAGIETKANGQGLAHHGPGPAGGQREQDVIRGGRPGGTAAAGHGSRDG